jgi:hypothetical protein
VLFALLLSLGTGSALSRRWALSESRVQPVAVAAIALLTMFLIWGLPSVFQQTGGASLMARVVITLLILTPLGLIFGIFFPLGIRRAEAVHRDLVPWAWAVNGSASVTASVLAIVLAMQVGFRVVWALSVVVYAAGVFALLRAVKADGTSSAART